MHAHVARHDAQPFSLDLAGRVTEQRMPPPDGRAFPAIEERRKDQPVAVQVGPHQQHGATDGIQANQLLAAQFAHQRALIRPGIEIEGIAARALDAVRLQDVLAAGQQPLEDIGGIILEIDIDPQHPILIVERTQQQMVAALGEDRAAGNLHRRRPARHLRRDAKAKIPLPDPHPPVAPGDGCEPPPGFIERAVLRIAFQHAEREATRRITEAIQQPEISIEMGSCILDRRQDLARGPGIDIVLHLL